MKAPFRVEGTLGGDVVWDANNNRVSPQEIAMMLNALNAEVERLRETQRKLAWLYNKVCIHTDYVIAEDECEECSEIFDLQSDPLVAAALKEAENGKA